MHRPFLSIRRSVRSIAVGLAATAMILGNVVSVGAAALTTASIELGDPRSSATTTYTTTASGFTTGTGIGCVQLDLGANADGSGAISGMDTSSSTLSSSTLITAGSWSVDNTASANHELRITHNTATENPTSSGNVVWGNVVNGDTEATTYYGVLTTYTNTDCSTGPTDTVTMAFIYKDGELVQLTIEPTLSFACVAVGSGQDIQPVNNSGTTTTVASGASGIDFGNTVTTSANGLSAHDLQVTTNASGGYVIYLRHTQQLTNVASDTIANHTGTNGSPTAFSAAGTEGWGYTTDDDTLTGGTADRFTNGGIFWAGFSTSNNPVVDNTAATAGSETTRVGHQVGIANSTPAGDYDTTMVYTIVATY